MIIVRYFKVQQKLASSVYTFWKQNMFVFVARLCLYVGSIWHRWILSFTICINKHIFRSGLQGVWKWLFCICCVLLALGIIAAVVVISLITVYLPNTAVTRCESVFFFNFKLNFVKKACSWLKNSGFRASKEYDTSPKISCYDTSPIKPWTIFLLIKISAPHNIIWGCGCGWMHE